MHGHAPTSSNADSPKDNVEQAASMQSNGEGRTACAVHRTVPDPIGKRFCDAERAIVAFDLQAAVAKRHFHNVHAKLLGYLSESAKAHTSWAERERSVVA